MPWPVLVAAGIGYLIGSIPVSDLTIRRHTDVDLRTVGDRNPGYWNARQTFGSPAAFPVFVGDTAKGALAAAVGWILVAVDGADRWWIAYVAAGGAMIGHAWPLFAGFRGGRSVLTFVGAACVLSPLSAALSIVLLLAATALTRSFAWGARVGTVAYPVVQLFVDGPRRTAATGVLMCIIGLRFALAARASTERQA